MSSDPAAVRVIAFPGAPNLPLFAADMLGYFCEAGVSVHFETTPSSVYQAEKLASEDFDIAFTAFDNVVAYNEGQGAIALPEGTAFCVLMGATQLEVSLVGSPEIKSITDLKGRSIALDAISTGFAFIFYDMLDRHGLVPDDCLLIPVGSTPRRWRSVEEGTHAATLTIEPFTSIARARGFNVLDVSTRLYGAYQGGIIASTRSWAEGHADRLSAFLGAYLRGLDWTLDPTNESAAMNLLTSKMTEVPPLAVRAIMQSLTSPKSGLTPRGEIIPAGMAQVLSLRSRYGGGGALSDWRKYLALEFYENAMSARTE